MGDGEESMAQYIAQYTSDYRALLDSARGRDVLEVEHLLRAFARTTYQPHVREIDLAFTARVMADAHWARKHPLSAIALARGDIVTPDLRTGPCCGWETALCGLTTFARTRAEFSSGLADCLVGPTSEVLGPFRRGEVATGNPAGGDGVPAKRSLLLEPRRHSGQEAALQKSQRNDVERITTRSSPAVDGACQGLTPLRTEDHRSVILRRFGMTPMTLGQDDRCAPPDR